ncbi:MAG TPA: rod shape-determining protein RodA [Stellaceae bacterium]|nr:rod shape-determining protein RodA [Stellaceae bacterium]
MFEASLFQGGDFGPQSLSFGEKVRSLNWGLLLLLTAIAGIGFAMLYSAANGSWHPWADKQALRFGVSVVVMLAVGLIDIRFWYRIAYFFYAITFALLVVVEVRGSVGLGAQRWIDLGFIQLQPSELMKIATVLVLARYFNGLTPEEIGRPWLLIVPAFLVLVPAGLVLKQPDLGTAMMLVAGGGVMFFLGGVRWWKFALVLAGAGGAVPVAWRFLRDYQKNRIYTFLNPENDPLGAGYHSLQSKIAIGSGGVFGKGFLAGSQAHLDFLPEKHTDFIFTMFAEEFGLTGGLVLLGLYSLVFFYGVAIAMRSRSHFGRLLALGLTTNFFLYVFINTAMVMGLIPVVGVPLPLISYGGTAMITVMFGFGIVMSVYVHRDIRLSRYGSGEL